MSITLTALQKQRRDTAANWTSVNPTLLAGEIGIESDTNKWKVGTGSAAWTALAYMPGSQLSAYPIVNVDISATAEIAVSKLADGTPRQLLQTDAAGTGVEWASNIDVPGTLDVTGAATFDAAVTVQGDLTVNGTTTTIDTANLAVEDKNIEIGKVASPTDVTADGGGITLKGTTDKTINWVDATDAWTFSEHVNIVSTKEYRIDGVKVLDATSLGSSVLITSANITDGTIVNADVNASAAIAGTKITPDFGSQALTTTGLISANGKVSFPLGTAALPSLHPGTDTNTGIYSPGADQVAISTNGTERMRLDSTGRLGLGTSTFASGGGQGIGTSAQINGSLYVYEGNNSADHGGAIAFGINNLATYTPMAQIKGKLEFAPGTELQGGIGIFTRPAAGGASGQTLTERVTIKSDGKVGIGTTSPNSALSIDGPATGGFSVLGNGAPIITLKNTDTTNFNTSQIALRDSGNNVACGIGFRNHSHGVSGSSSLQFYTRNAGTLLAPFTIDTAGTATFNSAASTAPFIAQINTGEVARIDSSGRLLVGTSTADTAYNDASTFVPQVQLRGGAGSSSGLSLTRTDGNGPRIWMQAGASGSNATNGALLGSVLFSGYDGANYRNGARIEAFVDATSGSDDMPGRLVFSTTADGASSPTERLRITSAGVLQVADAGNIAVGTTTGTKIGTATTQKLGFYNATPVVQPVAVADATDAASAITQLNALLAHMRTLGLIAT